MTYNTPTTEQPTVTFTVKGVRRDDSGSYVIYGTLVDGREAVCLPTEFYPGVEPAGSWSAVILVPDKNVPIVSVTSTDVVVAVLTAVIPELRDGQVRVMGVARQAGVRSKVAVASTVEGLDPVAVCVGKAANRIRFAAGLLGGERIDVVAWHPDPAVAVANALAPAAVDSVEIVDGAAYVTVPVHQMPAAVGQNGLNSRLVSEMVGVSVNLVVA